MQGADGVPRLAAQRIKDADDGGELARDAEIEMGILCGQGLELFILALRHDAALVLKDEMRAADDDLFVVDLAGDAVRNDVMHPRNDIPRGSARAFWLLPRRAFAIECG